MYKSYTEYVFSKYSSSFLRFISLLFPTHNTKGHFSDSDISRSLFMPMLKYAAASSKVRFDFSYIGHSTFIQSAPFLKQFCRKYYLRHSSFVSFCYRGFLFCLLQYKFDFAHDIPSYKSNPYQTSIQMIIF